MPQAISERGVTKSTVARSGRRSRLIKSIVFLALTGAALFLLIVWRRDGNRVRAHEVEIEVCRVLLQNDLDRLGQLPGNLVSIPGLPPLASAYSYLDDATRYFALRATEPIIVLATPRMGLILRRDGRFVILSEENKLRVEWMREADFLQAWAAQRQAASNAPAPASSAGQP